MNGRNRDSKQRESVDRLVQESLSAEVPEEVRILLTRRLQKFEERCRQNSSAGEHRWFRGVSKPLGWVVAFCFLVFSAALLVLPGSSEPNWLQVDKSFRSTPFFGVTFYMKDSPLEEPKQIEIWVGQGRRLRLRASDQLIFASGDRITAAYDLIEGHPTEPASSALEVLGFFKTVDSSLSLEALIKVLKTRMPLGEPKINTEATQQEELIVFDMVSESSAEQVRLWALRASRLPIRLMYWDTEHGDSAEVVFSYSAEKPAEFFSPQAFERFLQKKNAQGFSPSELVYLYMENPGGINLDNAEGE